MPRRLPFIPLALLLVVAAVTPSAATGLQGITPLAPGPMYLPLVMKYAGGPTLGGCSMFPPDNQWNLDISSYPVHPNSAAFIADINATGNQYLHADFGSFAGYGIPYVVVPGSQISVTITYFPPPVGYGDESDPGPYPIPSNAPVEAGSDAHVLVPAAAPQVSAKGSFVYVVKEDSSAELRPVTLGQRHEELVAVAQGLKGGEQVVTTGQLAVTPGGKVRVQEAATPRSGAGPRTFQAGDVPNGERRGAP